jgi:hypothetical protein
VTVAANGVQLDRDDGAARRTNQDVLGLWPARNHHVARIVRERVEDPGVEVLPRFEASGQSYPEGAVLTPWPAFTVAVVHEDAREQLFAARQRRDADVARVVALPVAAQHGGRWVNLKQHTQRLSTTIISQKRRDHDMFGKPPSPARRKAGTLTCWRPLLSRGAKGSRRKGAMADFAKIDQRVDAALFTEEPHLKQSLAGIAPNDIQLELCPCLPALKLVARFIFSTGIDAAADDPELADDKKLEVFLRDQLRPHMLDDVLGDSRRAKVLERSREERNRLLSDHRQIRDADGDLYIAPLTSDKDQRKAAPAVLQVVTEPFGRWERIAPISCRHVARLNPAAAREELGRLFDVLAQCGLAKRLALCEVAASGNINESAAPNPVRRGRPREDDLRNGIAAALSAMPTGPWVEHRGELADELAKAKVRFKPYTNSEDGVTCNSWKDLAQMYPGVFDERIRPHVGAVTSSGV